MKNFNIFQKITALSFVVVVAFWVVLAVTGTKEGNWNYLYSLLFGLIPLLGGLVGMFRAKLWGGLKSTLGRAVFSISFGLALWGGGESIWSYYNFVKHVPAPYPSLADIGFAPSIFFWVLGVAYLSVATGALYSLKKHHTARILVVIAPLLLLGLSYYLLIDLARGGVLIPGGETALKTVLDIAYPFGDFLALTISSVVFILSYRYFGGFYRTAISFILAGTAIMYVGDMVFSYTTTEGTYYNANLGDLILATGLACMTFGILAFATKPPKKVEA